MKRKLTPLDGDKAEKIKPTRTLEPLRGDGSQNIPVDIPPTERVRQWPVRAAPGVRTIFGWDVATVADALRQHAMGNPRGTGILLDDVKVNPIIGHCIAVRQEAFRTLPRKIVPGKGEQANRFAKFWQEVLPDILPDGTVDDWWLHYEFQGESLSAMDWEERTDGKDRWWLPYIKPWHPSQMYHYYRPDRGERTPDGQVLAAITRDRGPIVVEAGQGRWVHIQKGTLAPWLNATIRMLGEPYLGDTYTLRDNLALQERIGQGVYKLFHPVEWNDMEVDAAVQSVYGSGRSGVIPCPTTPEGGRKVDLEFVNANAAGAQIFSMTEQRLMRRFLITLLGQDMTTVGQTGGFAQAAIHSMVLWHKRERDAAGFGDARLQHYMGDDGKEKRAWIPYSGPIRSQITKWIAWFNFGSFEAAPYTFWEATPPEDAAAKEEKEAAIGAQRAAALNQFVAGVTALEQQLGVRLSDADFQLLAIQCGIKLQQTRTELEKAAKNYKGE